MELYLWDSFYVYITCINTYICIYIYTQIYMLDIHTLQSHQYSESPEIAYALPLLTMTTRPFVDPHEPRATNQTQP